MSINQINKFLSSFLILVLFSLSAFSQVPIVSYDFNSGYQGWTDNGDDSDHINNNNWSCSSNGVIFTKDNETNKNRITSPTINLSGGFSQIDFSFCHKGSKLDNGEGLIVQYSENGVNGWVTVATFVRNTDFTGDGNSNPHSLSFSMDNSTYNFTTTARFRFSGTANKNNEYNYIDDVIIEGSYYCDSNGNNTDGWDTGIRQVVFNTINNSTPVEDNNYSDFTAQSTDVSISTSYNLSVNVNTDGNWTNYTKAWIDWNQDGVFNTTDEEFDLGTATNVSNGATSLSPLSITIPATATLGYTRMRIASKYFSYPTACETDFDGEVEDYTINIISNCSTNTWTGAIDSDWNTTANWSCGSVPTSTTNVLIPTGVANFPEIYSADAAGLSNNIEIESGATLKIYDNYIEIAGTLLLNGFIDLVDEGQLIQTTGSIFDSTSTGYIERDQQGEGNRYRYNDWSSPVIKTGTALGTPFTVADVLRDGTDPNNPKAINFVSGYNGAVGSPIAIAEYWIYKYANSPTGDYNSWQQIKSTGNLKPGEGFLMKGTGNPGSSDQNYVFQGKPNNGTIQLSVAANNDYLIGNPYPSAIDAVQFLIDNPGVNGGALYFWEHYGGDSHNLADYQAGYATINLLGVSTPASSNLPSGVSSAGSSVKTLQRYIPVGQGFFFWAGGSNTTIEFNNGQRIFKTEASGESVFMKGTNTKTSKTATTVDTRPIIRIGFDASEIDHRQLIIGADEKATDNVDWGYDAIIYETLDDDMYWIIENDKYVIQGINTIDSETELPIGIQSKKGGIVSIKVDELINTPDDLEVYILDKTTNTTFDIKNGTFETILEPNTTFTNKYSIVFKQYEVLAINEEILDQNLLVYVNNSEKLIVIKNNTNFEIEGITLYNYLGQNIKQWNSKFDEEMLTLPVENNQGVYIIKILTSKGILTKKIIIE
ncbi:GEVED domain-containing protein [Lutibacter sp. TH_r2]|uniref:GEVED domain-containing protein n=1 Tax=Lutibacter sp. TH_r2 TaxID=3082083 RepID=UPI002953BCF9|nr:GEVED domain-containing protein [Lutibacter sp. TH_r2]MDV7186509.1 GEVED domain-containing protein [Lutibacter sp. TH_r2]